MRLAVVTSVYPYYSDDFYGRNPDLLGAEYCRQKAALDYDAYSWHGVWSHWLKPYGYEVLEVITNLSPLQTAWAREAGLKVSNGDLEQIAVEQVRCFKPEIVWFEDANPRLMRRICEGVGGIRLTAGWTGSALPAVKFWKDVDVVLSCAPESVENLCNSGIHARHLNHGFDARIVERLANKSKSIAVSFVGQLVAADSFHLRREKVLSAILDAGIDIEIFSPNREIGWRPYFKRAAQVAVHHSVSALRRLGVSESVLEHMPVLNRALYWKSAPPRPVNHRLRSALRPEAFGLAMYQLLRDSNIALNIHADSSPRYASNMRLFEITGAGTCMVTDYKPNMAEMFELDSEVVVYRSQDECVEKMEWLLGHPERMAEIATAGQRRCLSQHSFERRAAKLHHIFCEEIARLGGQRSLVALRPQTSPIHLIADSVR